MMKIVARFLPAFVVCLALSGRVAAAGAVVAPTFDPEDFTTPVQNRWFPLVPGTTYLFEAHTADGLVRTEVTVTAEQKLVDGVWATTVHDVVWLDVEGGPTVLIEDTLDWYAADHAGNVWYLGEATVEHLYNDNWTPTGTSTEGSWEAGVDGAEPGFIMPANPHPGLAYRQEHAAGVAEDRAKVERLNAKLSVPYGTFSNALVTKEWTPLSPGDVERKYYVAGIGLVLTEEFHGKGTVREALVAITAPTSPTGRRTSRAPAR